MEQRKSVAVTFVNWTDEDFTHKWDNTEYIFRAGVATLLQDYLANHFAKHLAQREINKAKLLMTDPKFQIFYDKCFIGEKIEAETDLKLEMKMEEVKKVEEPKIVEPKKFCEFCDSKGGRHTKDCPQAKKNKPEDSFEGLK